jgi:hypothetical protein
MHGQAIDHLVDCPLAAKEDVSLITTECAQSRIRLVVRSEAAELLALGAALRFRLP